MFECRGLTARLAASSDSGLANEGWRPACDQNRRTDLATSIPWSFLMIYEQSKAETRSFDSCDN